MNRDPIGYAAYRISAVNACLYEYAAYAVCIRCAWCAVLAQTSAAGQPQSAQCYGKASIILSIIGIVLSIIFIILLIVYFVDFASVATSEATNAIVS